MKEIIIIILALLALLIPKPAQAFCIKGEGQVVKRSFDLDAFDEISVECSADVQIRYGKTQKVEVQGQNNIIDQLTTTVSSGRWEIDFEKSVCYLKDFTIYITVPSMEMIKINGSGDVSGNSTFKQEDFTISINGSGNVKFDVEAQDVEVEIDGSGDVSLAGKTKSLDIEIDGSGDVSAYDLEVTNCSIDVNGSGDSEVNVSEYLHANINGSGDVDYKGDVGKIHVSESGSGDVQRK